MERTYRNLQKISGSFFVSLPKKWVENFNLSKKSSILITVRSDGNLLISPKHRQEVDQYDPVMDLMRLRNKRCWGH